MQDCERFTDMLPAYAEGALDSAGRTALERHLAQCALCARRIEELRRLETACAGVRDIEAGADAAAELERRIDMTVTTMPYPVRTSDALRRVFADRWVTPLTAAAAVLAAVALFILPGLFGGAGLTWAEVQGSVSASPCVHYVATDIATGKTVGETWYSPAAHRTYNSLPASTGPYYVLVDDARKEKWLYDRAKRTLTIHELEAGRRPEGSIFQAMLDPGSFPEWPRRVAKAESSDGLTRFDVFSTAEGPTAEKPVMSIWVDDKTKLSVRAETHQRNSSGTAVDTAIVIDYPATGPADVYAVGVPRAVKIVDARRSADLAGVLEKYNSCRNAFVKQYRAFVVSDIDTEPDYIVSRSGDKERYEMYGVPADFRKASLNERATLLRTGKLDLLETTFYNGLKSVTVRAGGDPITAPGLSSQFAHVRRIASPSYLGWKEIPLAEPFKIVQNADPALAGMVGIEGQGAQMRNRFWLDPQHDYLVHRYDWEEKKDGNWATEATVETLEYAQTASGKWYPRTRQITDTRGTWQMYIEIDESALLSDALFDVAVGAQ